MEVEAFDRKSRVAVEVSVVSKVRAFLIGPGCSKSNGRNHRQIYILNLHQQNLYHLSPAAILAFAPMVVVPSAPEYVCARSRLLPD